MFVDYSLANRQPQAGAVSFRRVESVKDSLWLLLRREPRTIVTDCHTDSRLPVRLRFRKLDLYFHRVLTCSKCIFQDVTKDLLDGKSVNLALQVQFTREFLKLRIPSRSHGF